MAVVVVRTMLPWVTSPPTTAGGRAVRRHSCRSLRTVAGVLTTETLSPPADEGLCVLTYSRRWRRRGGAAVVRVLIRAFGKITEAVKQVPKLLGHR